MSLFQDVIIDDDILSEIKIKIDDDEFSADYVIKLQRRDGLNISNTEIEYFRELLKDRVFKDFYLLKQ